MQVTGIIKVIQKTETFDSGFSKRVVVIETDEKYPQEIPVEFFKDKTTLLDSYAVGDNVTIDINLRGSGEFNGRYYLSANGWKLEKLTPANTPVPPPIGDDNPF